VFHVSIWAIADIHASRTDPSSGRLTKPMDVFGPAWSDHLARIESAWCRQVQVEDTVVIAGDTEWALHLDEAAETLGRIDSWPGTKVLVRGNHDYWWSSKATSRVRAALPASIVALHNNAVQADGFNICGAKGSPVPGGADWTEQDAKLLNRERERLALSLAARDPSLPTIVALHFPPFYRSQPETIFRLLLEQEAVRCCVYGHLHGAAAAHAIVGLYGTVEYRLVASDFVGFRPVLIGERGDLASKYDPESEYPALELRGR
jgi:predicted phosphohydrolase